MKGWSLVDVPLGILVSERIFSVVRCKSRQTVDEAIQGVSHESSRLACLVVINNEIENHVNSKVVKRKFEPHWLAVAIPCYPGTRNFNWFLDLNSLSCVLNHGYEGFA